MVRPLVKALTERIRSAWLNLSLARKGIIVATIPLVTVLVASLPVALNDWARSRANDDLLRSRQARENAGTILAHMLQAQNHMLGYIITADSAQLLSFRESSDAARRVLEATEFLITDSTTRPLLAGVRTRLTGLQAAMAHEIELASRSGAPSPTSGLMMLSQENRAIADLEASIEALSDAEDASLRARMARLEAMRTRRTMLGVSVVLVGALGTGVSAALFMFGVAGRVERVQLSAAGLDDGGPERHHATDEIGRLAATIQVTMQETARTADRLRIAIRAARIEVIEIRPELNQVNVVGSGTLFRQMGYTPDKVPRTLTAFAEMIHVDDRDRITHALQNLAPGWEYALEFRMEAGPNDWRWMELRGASPDSEPGSTGPSRSPHAVAVGILLDVTERRSAEEHARLALATADRANKAKSEFLSRMSHELRTPLNAVLGFAQLLEIDALTTDQRDSVSHILRGGRYLLDLINEVLDLARIESGRLGLSIEPVPIVSIVEAVTALISPMASEFGVRLNVQSPTTEFARADRQRLQQVLLNLLSNAIKYNRQGGSVALTVEAVDDVVRIHVRDTGPGMSPSQLARLFTPFERLDAARTGVEGTGLGLALSRTIVEAMGGEITVESAVGVGSTFTVELEAAEVTPEELDALSLLPSSETPVTVVYIEDNEANLRLVERIAAQRPRVRIVSVQDGNRALPTILREKPALVLLDINLPGLSGDQILQRLRSSADTIDVPVAILSADATPAQVSRLKSLGAQHYLTKPVEIGKLLELFDAYSHETRAA